MKNFFLKPWNRVNRKVKNAITSVNVSPIWVLGNQKSGTTAIAELIADYGAISSTIDFRPEYYIAARQIFKIYSRDLPAEKFINQLKYYFSRELIKEPNLTFIFKDISKYLYEAKILFVIRDPRDNIRSILNRVGLPGNKNEIVIHDQKINDVWQSILRNEGLNLREGTYIENLAYRWCAATDVYLDNRQNMHLLKYESFKKNKEATISNICQKIGIKKQNDISHKVDVQFQPKGDIDVQWDTFFGPKNLSRIEEICGSRMNKLNYNL